MTTRRVQLPYGVDDAWRRLHDAFGRLGAVEEASVDARRLVGTAASAAGAIRFVIAVRPGATASSAVLEVEADRADVWGDASREIVDRLVDDLLSTTPETSAADPRAEPVQPAGPAPSAADELERLANLRDQGILTGAEFAVLRDRVVGVAPAASVTNLTGQLVETSAGAPPSISSAPRSAEQARPPAARFAWPTLAVAAAGVVIGVGVWTSGVVGGASGSAGGTHVALSGYAAVSTPLSHAQVKVYRLAATGRTGALLATTVTDANGHYATTVSRRPTDALLLVTSGGSYVDEMSNQPVAAAPGNSLRTILAPGVSSSSLTPLSSMATAGALGLAARHVPLGPSVAVSFAAVARQFNLPTVTDIYPAVADIPPSQQPVVPTFTSRQLGLVLAGLNVEAASDGVTAFALSDAISLDLTDGNMDGHNGTAPVLMTPVPITNATPLPTNGANGTALPTNAANATPLPTNAANGTALPTNATTAVLQTAINSFAGSSANKTGVPAPQISPDPCTVTVDINSLYVTTSSGPTFRDGTPGVGHITAVNASGSFHCTLSAGSLGPQFSLSPDCTIAYNGSPIVGAGTAVVSSPFTVVLTDSSTPPKSVTIADLRITVVHPPPTVNLRMATAACPPGPASCPPQEVATATGVAPFTFEATGLPPGLRVVTSAQGPPATGSFGALEGSEAWLISYPSQTFPNQPLPGSYHYELCVVDATGFQGCAAPAPSVVVSVSPTQWTMTAFGLHFPGTCQPGGACTFRYDTTTYGLATHLTITLAFSGQQVTLTGSYTGGGNIAGVAISAGGSVSGSGQANAAYAGATHAQGTLTASGSAFVLGQSASGSQATAWTADATTNSPTG
jgi:hypothetical protein